MRFPILHDGRLGLGWAAGLLRLRWRSLFMSAAGVALAVALLASLGAFLASSKSTMTARAIDTVAVDWQVETQPGADLAAVANQVAAAGPVVATEPVLFATATGFSAAHETTTQTTGPGQVLGLPASYRKTFPAQVRDLIGATGGALLYQQTAANLAARPGDTISIGRTGLEPVEVVVDGIVDLPQADTLFQNVGAPPGAQPQAPPDNVLLLPASTWHELFDPLAASRPDQTRTQVHARLDHRLPADPAAAYQTSNGQALNLEARLAGTARVGNNLAAVLASARSDALYAQVLFLFLGMPGAVLAALLTATVAASAGDRRRREQALLRARGASERQLAVLAGAEALLIGAAGSAVGIALASIVSRWALPTPLLGGSTRLTGWQAGAAALAGLLISALAVAVPALRDARRLTVAAARREVGRPEVPRWLRWRLDLVLLALSGLVFWLTSRNGYKLVLAPEGVPTISVDYWAFAGPALLWVGAGLLSYRLTLLFLTRGRGIMSTVLQPLSGALAPTIAASLERRRRPIARGVAVVALTVGFAASTAVFNSTYRQQAEIDAVLTNGADVTVTTSPGTSVAPSSAMEAPHAATPGARHVEPVQHRFAYVGADLQDLYGVDATTILAAGRLQDAYFQGGSAADLLATLRARPDSVLVSAETVRDFQLHPGDELHLRLQDGTTKQYVDVPFHYVGVVREFPTAPSDSFLVANADYITETTGSDAVGAFLVDTGPADVASVADSLRKEVGTDAQVTDIDSSRRVIGSSLTAVNLDGLTRIELSLALVLAATATGLTLWLGLAERRRTFAIAAALGAHPRQIGGFVWAEAGTIVLAGLTTGAFGAWALSHMLVKVLTGVFDPPPAALAVPWVYLLGVLATALSATAVACVTAVRATRVPHMELLRAL